MKTVTFEPSSVGHSLLEVLNVLEKSHQNVVITPNRLIHTIHKQSNGLFTEGEQHDLCELWVWLMDKIHEECAVTYLDIPKKINNALQRGIETTLFKYQNGRYSDILKCVQGSQIAIVVCNQCKYRVSNIEPFTVITLNLTPNIEQNSPDNIIDLLQRYFEKETLDDWKCDKCSSKGGCRLLKFYEVPQTLVIVLKRFQINNQGEFIKMNNRVTIPDTLYFHHSAIISLVNQSDPLSFKLCGIANHYGSYFGGHYTATSLSSSGWKYIDDNEIHDIDNIQQYLDKNQTGYMLFYERK